MLNPKTTKWRNKKWLLAQRDMPCVYSGSSEVEAAHIRLGSHAGLAQKPDDWLTISLAANLHRQQHSQGELSFHLQMANEYPHTLMEMVRSYAKMRCVTWLLKNGQEREALDVLRS